jgi:hypothetical protein
MTVVDEAEFTAARRAGLPPDAGGRTLDADLVRRHCHELRSDVDPRGIHVRGAEITGTLVDTVAG